MFALSLKQPWAALVALGIKRIENRTTRIVPTVRYGETLGLHASLECNYDDFQRIKQIAPELASRLDWHELSLLRGQMIGTFRVTGDVGGLMISSSSPTGLAPAVDLEPDQMRWYFGKALDDGRRNIGYIVTDATRLPTPVACRGMLGLWKVPEDVVTKMISV